MRYKFLIVFLIVLAKFIAISAQDNKEKFSASGYLSFTESAMHINFPQDQWYWESLLHNRLNFYYYANSSLSFSLQLRNRVIYGDRLLNDLFDFYRNSVSDDAGIADMSWTYTEGGSYLFNSAVDRLWMKYTGKKFEITAGRQRINWGVNYVWNANDWFNNFSFFDIDYLERPGSDALRFSYFTGVLSQAELVIKTDSSSKITASALYKTNIKQYDLQFQGGVLSGEDLALGFGWAGGLGNLGFRGEMSYFHPLSHFSDTTGLFLISVALDYTFPNSLMIQAEGFYNQQQKGLTESFADFYSRPSSVKNLSFTEINLFTQVSYPVTPLINVSLALIFYPEVKGFYLGPSVSWLPANNLEAALFFQYFNGEFPVAAGVSLKQELAMAFVRVKWSF